MISQSKLKYFSSLWFFILLTSNVHPQDRGFGLGMILGEPTGISAKQWLTRTTALDFAAAWSFVGNNSLTLHADYLNYNFKLIDTEDKRLPFYYGIGGRMKFDDDQTGVAVRVPIGLNYLFENVTLDLFVEIVPLLELAPKTEFNLNAALGIRYFFH